MDFSELQNHLQTARRAGAEARVSLFKRRQWFADPPAPEAPPTPTPTPTSPAGALNAEQGESDGKTSASVPYERFKQMLDERKALDEKLKAFETAQQKAETERLEKEKKDAEQRGEFQKLYEGEKVKASELQKQVDELAKYKAMVAEQVKKQIEGLPDYLKPLLDGKSPLEQMEYLSQHGDKLKPNKAPNLDQGEQGGGTGKTKPSRTNPLTF